MKIRIAILAACVTALLSTGAAAQGKQGEPRKTGTSAGGPQKERKPSSGTSVGLDNPWDLKGNKGVGNGPRMKSALPQGTRK